MSRGKYSPNLPTSDWDYTEFKYNAKGELPPSRDKGEKWNSEVHFANYDDEGYDDYGYSAYDAHGNFVGDGKGIDRNGYTEMDYLCDEELWNSVVS